MGDKPISLEKSTAAAGGAGLAGLLMGGPMVGAVTALSVYGISTFYNIMTQFYK